jgi:hypothetical protein
VRLRERLLESGSIALPAVGIALLLVGLFSPWIDHPTAGLELTGFELGEWIKFAPDVREGTSGLNRAGFYLPASAAAIGLATMGVAAALHKRLRWVLLAGGAAVALLPFPLLEEVSNLAGIKANWARFGLIGLGLISVVAVAILQKRVPSRMLGATLVTVGLAGLIGVNATFAAAEPIVERLYNRLIDPGTGLAIVQAGHIALIGGGIWQLISGKRKKGDPISESPFAP